MKPRKRAKSTISTRKQKVKIPEKTKIALINKVLDLLIKVLQKTKERYERCKKPLRVDSRLKKTELEDIAKIDTMLRQCEWLDGSDKKWLELDVADNGDGTYGPSCRLVGDVLMYMERIPGIIIITDTKA